MKRKLVERERDVVEDSEPEREERRRRYLERQRSRKPASSAEDGKATVRQYKHLSSLPGSLDGAIDQRSTSELELKNTPGGRGSGEERDHEPREPNGIGVAAPQHSALKRNHPSLPLITTIEECHLEQHDKVDELSPMQICHFAYQPLKDPVPFRGSSFPERQPDFLATSRCHVEPRQFLKQMSGKPSDAKVSALSKCVCCHLRWTTKKTVKQKRAHMETCSRRHAISPDTFLSLINKEASVTPLHANPSNDCQVPSGALSESPATLMGAIISADSGKRNRRKQVISTVRTLPETRESILDKARDLLGQFVDPQGENIGRSCTDLNEVKPIQLFGTSMLARRNAEDVLSHKGKEIQSPPSTQTFGESALGKRRTTSRMLDAYYNATSVATTEIQGL
ncbi:hypothetical protein EDD16DRAFT_1541986 [Pisolithus croceorrhizus]|nr:hypothetical protein EDD16DRAFT_1541986 [Pisolithus croceorrhizus]